MNFQEHKSPYTHETVKASLPKFRLQGFELAGHNGLTLRYQTDGCEPTDFDSEEKAIDSLESGDFTDPNETDKVYVVYKAIALIRCKIEIEPEVF